MQTIIDSINTEIGPQVKRIMLACSVFTISQTSVRNVFVKVKDNHEDLYTLCTHTVASYNQYNHDLMYDLSEGDLLFVSEFKVGTNEKVMKTPISIFRVHQVLEKRGMFCLVKAVDDWGVIKDPIVILGSKNQQCVKHHKGKWKYTSYNEEKSIMFLEGLKKKLEDYSLVPLNTDNDEVQS